MTAGGHPGAVFSGPSVLMIQSGQKTQTRRVMKKLRVFLPRRVSSDDSAFMADGKPSMTIRAGLHTARIGDAGAVFVTTQSGTLGVKPGEFNLCAPWVKHGTTALSAIGNGKKVWTVVPHASARIRVLETWRTHERASDSVDGVLYAADGAFIRIQNTAAAADAWVVAHNNNTHRDNWRTPIFMPAWASRILLEIHMVRLMRLQEISKEDAIAEGVIRTDYGQHEHRLSADGGKTWGIVRLPKAGWSYGPSKSDRDCLGSPQMAYGNAWNRLHAGVRWNLKDEESPWDKNPWVWAYTFSVVKE